MLLTAGCARTGARPPASCPVSPVAPVSPVSPVSALPACPVDILHAAPPTVTMYASLAVANRSLRSDTPSPVDDLIAQAKASGPAFGTSFLIKAYAGSTRVSRHHAVFVQGKRVVVLWRLGDVMTSIPRPDCESVAPDDVLGARIVAGPPNHPHVGHARYRRSQVTTAPTLPDVPAPVSTPSCQRSSTFQIEDHFVDLDSGEHLVTLVQIYRGPMRDEASPALAMDRFALTDDGVTVAGCESALRWPLPAGE